MESIIKFTLVFIFASTVFSCSSTKNSITKNSASKETIKIKHIKADSILIKVQDTNTTNNQSKKTLEELTEISIDTNDIEQFNHEIFDNLLTKNVSLTGEVNYKGFILNIHIFKQYLNSLSKNLPNEDWSKEDKLAYWMNAYNAFTIKLIIDNYPTKSIKDIKNAWDARIFKLGDKWYNLSEIEHKILRKMNDPRIHFGINCASYSCPPLHNRAFTANNVNTVLDNLAHKFINNKQYNTISKNAIQLSKIFQWYAKDFKTESTLIDYLNKYSDITINKSAKKSYKKYDWSLNE